METTNKRSLNIKGNKSKESATAMYVYRGRFGVFQKAKEPHTIT